MDPMLVLLAAGAVAAASAWLPAVLLGRRSGTAAREPAAESHASAAAGPASAPAQASVRSVIRAAGWMVGLTALVLLLFWAVTARSEIGPAALALVAAGAVLIGPAWWLLSTISSSEPGGPPSQPDVPR